ncbi:MAG: acyl-CoA dehydrogenase family protein [Blastocatellia bacterium]
MKIDLTPAQESNRAEFRAFVDEEVMPFAGSFDQQGFVTADVIAKLKQRKYLAPTLPEESEGRGLDVISLGLLCEELGRGCSSLRSLLTVHGMVSQAIWRWGSKSLKQQWLSKLANGERTAAFALTEPNAGSDAASVETEAKAFGDHFVLNGHKKWITFGQIADLFLIFARCEGASVAFLLERETPGLSINPISGMLGVRASMLADLHLADCIVPQANIVGKIGFGFSHVASTALDYGRYTVAWGCVGIAQACLEASVRYAETRKQFGSYLKDHQLIQQLIARMLTNTKAARLICLQAGHLRSAGDPDAIMDSSIAKYFASRIATEAALDAVQIHGANGCSSQYPVERYLRDAKIMEIIEGSTQIQEINIAGYAQRLYGN